MKSHKLPPITKQETAEVLDALVNLNTCAAPLLTITPEERLTVPRLGARRTDFAKAALEAAFEHPECIPPSINLMPMIGRLIVNGSLQEAREKLRDLLSKVEDTRHHLGHEIYAQSLEIYHLLKMQRSSNSEIDAAVGEMKQRLCSPRLADIKSESPTI